MADISVDNKELLSPRDFRREFATKMDALEKGKIEKLVLMRRGEMIGVILTVEDYAGLLESSAQS